VGTTESAGGGSSALVLLTSGEFRPCKGRTALGILGPPLGAADVTDSLLRIATDEGIDLLADLGDPESSGHYSASTRHSPPTRSSLTAPAEVFARFVEAMNEAGNPGTEPIYDSTGTGSTLLRALRARRPRWWGWNLGTWIATSEMRSTHDVKATIGSADLVLSIDGRWLASNYWGGQRHGGTMKAIPGQATVLSGQGTWTVDWDSAAGAAFELAQNFGIPLE